MCKKTFLGFGLTVSLALLVEMQGYGQALSKKAEALCSNVTMLDSKPFSALPVNVRTEIRKALTPDILAFAKATDISMQEAFNLQKVSLDAIQVPMTTKTSKLYVVHWGDALFGVNGAIWIVEVNSQGARNLIAPDEGMNRGRSFGGWGMQVLSDASGPYPELMFASKGYHAGGGAEAEAECVRKIGAFYKSVACPVDCFDNLNNR
ncbi:hypothetical protein [Edaphobacter bradus]|uniref:hypothetical protein n=1 Tax=Edaphobacter bradus TaxID=2259016 RepID=UPI0021DFE11A|nr:hypothetical protein [Edaphobacter bradus]